MKTETITELRKFLEKLEEFVDYRETTETSRNDRLLVESIRKLSSQLDNEEEHS